MSEETTECRCDATEIAADEDDEEERTEEEIIARRLSAMERRQRAAGAISKVLNITNSIRRARARIQAIKVVESETKAKAEDKAEEEEEAKKTPTVPSSSTPPTMTTVSPRLIRTVTAAVGSGSKSGSGSKQFFTSVMSSTQQQQKQSPSLRSAGTVVSLKCRPVPSNAVIAIDNGSSFVKAGVCGEETPRTVVPSVCSYDGDLTYFGQSAMDRSPKAFMDPRSDADWDAVEDCWAYVLERQMRVDSSEHAVVMTDMPQQTEAHRCRAAELIFEGFGCTGLCVRSPAILSLFSQGITTGVALDCGNRLQIVPVVDGSELRWAECKQSVAFVDLTERLSRLMLNRGYSFSTFKQLMTSVRPVKESICYVAIDPVAEATSVREERFTLQTGQVIALGEERFLCPEAMFNPQLAGLESFGVHESLARCIDLAPIDVRKSLLSNVVLAGGSTLFPGFQARLEKELLSTASHGGTKNIHASDIRIVAPRNRKYLAWSGASMLGSTPRFEDECMISAAEYEEKGSSCFRIIGC